MVDLLKIKFVAKKTKTKKDVRSRINHYLLEYSRPSVALTLMARYHGCSLGPSKKRVAADLG